MTIPPIPVNESIVLKQFGSWPETKHVFDEPSAMAVRMALAVQRPLLVRGDPGTGKSQLARAAAQVLGKAFISEVVNASTEPQDLQWRFDAVGRLGEAQAFGARGGVKPVKRRDSLDPRRFLSPGPLWWAFDWDSASACYASSCHKLAKPIAPEGWSPRNGCVLLIDEIDKADSDVPNSLLETLGNGRFSVPWLRDTVVGPSEGVDPPLVIFTTNEEKELPAAFQRRCLVLHYEDMEDSKFVTWLIERGKLHFPELDEKVLGDAARMLIVDRASARSARATPPGQAEYLDVLKALSVLESTKEGQKKSLMDLAKFAFKKHRRTGYGDA